MRNLRRFYAVAIAIAMLVGMLAPVAAFAAGSDYAADANVLHNLGLYQGIDKDKFNPDLDSTLNRQTAATMVLRMFGLEQTALEMDEKDAKAILADKFKDASAVDGWALKQVAYAVDNDIIKGFPDGTFQPKGLLTGRQYCTLVLKNLGYTDFTFEAAGKKFAEVSGASAAEQAAFDANSAIKKNILVGISRKALDAKMENGKVTLIQQLVNEKAVTVKAAKDAGFPVDEPTATTAPTAAPTTAPSSVPSTVYGTVNVTGTFEPARSVAVISGGATQGEALVKFVTLTFKASPDKDASVTGVTFTRSGLSGDSDIDGVTAWDGANKVSSSTIFSASKCVLTFLSPISLKAGESKSIVFKADINKAAPAGGQIVFSINSDSDIKANNATINGTFPMTSGIFTVVALAANSLGTLTVTIPSDSPATGNVDPSTKDVTLAKFKLTSANEALVMKSFIVSNNGTSADTDVTNLRLMKDNKLVSNVVDKFSSRKAGFTFVDGVGIEKGGNVVLTLVGDIANSGATRTVIPYLDKTTDIISTGTTYGTTVVAVAAGTATETAKTLTIKKGELVVSLDTSTPPAGNVKKDGKKQLLAVFKLQAIGEPVQVTKINIEASSTGFNLNDAVSNIKLENADGVNLANIDNPFTAANTNQNKYITITPQTVDVNKPLLVKAFLDITNHASLTVDTDDIKLGLGDAEAKDIEAKGTISGEDTSVNLASEVYGKIMVIGNLGVTPAYIPFASADYAFINEVDHVVARMALSSNISSEDVVVTAVELGLTAPGGADANIASTFKNMKLKDTNGNVISDVKTTPTAAGTQFLFKPALVLKSGVVFNFNVVADMANTIAGGEDDYTVTFVSVTSTGATTSNDISTLTASGSASTGLFGTPVAAGNLTIINSAVQNVEAANVQRGSTNVKLAAGTLANASQEIIRLTKIRLKTTYANSLNAGHLTNVRLVDGAGKVLKTLDSLTSGVKDVTLDNALECRKSTDGNTEISLLADFVSGATVGGTVKVLFGDADGGGATTDLEYTGKSSSVTVQTKNVSDAGDQGNILFTVTPSKVDVTAVTISNPIGTGTAQPVNGIEIARFIFKNSGTESVALKNIALDDVLVNNKFLGQVDHGLTLYNQEDGTALSAEVTANATNALNIPLTTIKAIAPNTSLTVSVRVSTAGTLAASPSATIRVLKESTTYVKTESATLAGGPPAVVTGTGYAVDNSSTAGTVTVIKQ